MTFGDIILEKYESLPPRMKGVARFLMENQEEVAILPMREVSERASTSTASLQRLATALGFDGFNAVRRKIREDLADGKGHLRYSKAGASIIRASRPDSVAEKSRKLVTDVLESSKQVLEQENLAILSEFANVLKHAKRVYVMGGSSNQSLAFHFCFITSLYRPDVVLVDHTRGDILDMLLDISESDAFLTLTFDPYSREVMRAAEYVSERGAPILLITDSPLAPLAKLTRNVFVAPSMGVGPYQTPIPIIAALEVISFILFNLSSDEGMQRMSRRFDLMAEQGRYL